MFKKFIGDRAFYRSAFAVALPIMLQNFITNLVNMLDNVMVGSLGTEQVSGVAIINQLIFIFNLAIFGAVSGAGIFTSQYFGKNDMQGIRYTIRFKLIVCAFITALVMALFGFAPKLLIGLYLHEGSEGCDTALAMKYALTYLRIMMMGFIPYVITQVYASTLKETGQTFVPMMASAVAVAVNTILNYLLIFGIGFFPKLGVAGAAWGTVVSRVIECLVVLVYASKNKAKHEYFDGAVGNMYIPLTNIKRFSSKGIILIINEIIWATGMSLLAMCYSSYGLAIVAGYSISSTVLNLLNISFRSLGIAIGIIAGRYLGADEFDKATDSVNKLNFFAVCVSIVIGIVAFFVADIVPNFYNVSPESERWAVYFIKTSAIFMPFLCYENSAYFILRAGGRVVITSIFDGYFVFFGVCTVAFIFKSFAPIWLTYIAVQFCDVLKAILGFVLLKSRIWVRNFVGGN